VQVQQLDFISERKRWEAAKARQAPPEDDDMIEEFTEDAPLPKGTNVPAQRAPEMTEADYVAAQEEHELQHLIASMEQEACDNDAASQHFGSDDEDYDELLLECAAAADQQYQQQHPSLSFEDVVPMDVDMTDG
jgi:hypothetical protein